MQLFCALYQSMKHLSEVGKNLYKTTNKATLKDYTLRSLRQLVRKEQGAGGAADGGVVFG